MKTPMPKPVQAVCVMVSNIVSTQMTPKGNYYTSKQLRAAMVAASALIDSGMYARKYGDELLNVREALATIKEAL